MLDVSSVFDCAHSSITSASTSKHRKATTTTRREHKSTFNKNKKLIDSSTEQKLQTIPNPNGKQKCKKESPKTNNSEKAMQKTNLNDTQIGSATSGNVWTRVVQVVHDTQNVVMLTVVLVLIYLFCYDRTVRT